MNKVCLPEDLIKEYAAKHPNEQGVTQTQKVFCLAMMMRQDKIEPFEETYRWGVGVGVFLCCLLGEGAGARCSFGRQDALRRLPSPPGSMCRDMQQQ